MNNKIRKGAAWTFILAMLVTYSCDDSFLDVPATGALNQELLANGPGLEAALISAYSQVNGRANRMASPSQWVWGSIRGGDANKGTDPGDFSDINPIQRYEALPTQGVINDLYQGSYEGVARANAVLRILKLAPEETTAQKDQKKSVSAQARFLRAHFYFQLKRAFNNTPYVDENIDVVGGGVETGIEKIKNDVDLWPKIEADLQYAVENLAATQGQVGRVNSWAAKAYLAKAYMYQGKFAQAKTLYDDIIANGVTSNNKKYGLVPNYANVFKASNDNHEESVWAYQAAANTGSVNNANPEFDLNWPYNTGSSGPGNCCSFFQPTFELANSFRTSGGLPLLDGSYNNGTNQLVTDMGKEAGDPFTPDAGPLDPRIDHSIGRRGIPYLDWGLFPGKSWIRNQPNAGPYQTKKYAYYQSDKGSLQDNSSWTPGYTAINYTIIRFADVLLMAAEAEIEVGSLTTAQNYINMIRTRAANSIVMNGAAPAANYVIANYTAPFADKAAARVAVRFERKLELSGEGHRFFDLMRWGADGKALIKSYIAYEKDKYPSGAYTGISFTDNQDEWLPIPQNQIDLLGADILKQNPGF